jgi:hypothetical protein
MLIHLKTQIYDYNSQTTHYERETVFLKIFFVT